MTKENTSDDLKVEKDIVKCAVVVSDLSAFNATPSISMVSPNGKISVPVKSALTGLVMNLYELMKMSGQKEIILKLEDTSSPLIVDKRLHMTVSGMNQNTSKNGEQGTSD